MKPKEELDLILTLIRKYNLPLSPILEYSIQEQINNVLLDSDSFSIEDGYSVDAFDDFEDELSLQANDFFTIEDEEASIDNCIKLITYLRKITINVIKLNPDARKRTILMRFISGNSITSIADSYGLSSERIRQLINSAVGEMSDFNIESCELVRSLKDGMEALQATVKKQNITILELESQLRKSNLPEDLSEQQCIPEVAYTTRIEDLTIPVRLKNALLNNKIGTIFELSQLTVVDFFKLKNAGRKSYLDAQKLLAQFGLEFKESLDERYDKYRGVTINH